MSSQMATLDDGPAASTYFDELAAVEESGFETIGLNLAAHQVWAVRTSNGNYAKVLIESVQFDSDGNASLQFDWAFRADGGRVFE